MTDVLKPSTTPAELYLDLLKKSLTRYIFPEPAEGVETVLQRRTLRWAFYRAARPILALKNLDVVPRRALFDPNLRAIGRDSPKYAETMVGLKRLENIQYCARNILRDKTPGDFIETGAWRGGACIFMRAILKVYGDLERIVWVADSFKGLPKPDLRKFPDDAGDI